MPRALINGIHLFYEELGQGAPLVFVHEFAGDYQSWHLQVRFFSRRYRTITFNARGYPPSDVPDDPGAYSQQAAVEDIKGLLDHLHISKAHICGLSMGGYATLIFGLTYPARALSLTVAGCGYGSGATGEGFRKDVQLVARRFEEEGMRKVAEFYTRGPTRVQLMDKDPKGWQEFYDQFVSQSDKGHALTIQGVQLTRPSIFDLERQLEALEVPTLIITGDEDDPCLEPGVFMKRKIPSAGLLVIPKSGHVTNLEEPDAFNRAVLDFITAVESGRWSRRNPQSQTGSAILPTAQVRKAQGDRA
ncbi:MAG: alpha/beta fold hydrolase [Candidatus Methylomirabilia bacterium]